MTVRAERQARRLLAAYPWRVRAEQGDEIVGTVLDALAAGARRLPVRTAVDLVRGGWRVRARRRPPWPTAIAYWLGLRISPRWIQWVYDDLEAPDYVRNRRLCNSVVWFAVVAVLALVFRDPLIMLYGSGGLVGLVAHVPRDREQRRARYGLAAGGSDPRLIWIRRHRPAMVPDVPVAPLALAIGTALAAGAALCTAAMAGSHPRPEDWDLEVTIHPAVVLDSGHILAATLGLLAGLVVAAAGIRKARRRTIAPPPVAAPRGTAVMAALVAGGLSVASGILAVTLWWRWAPYPWGYLVAFVGPIGAGLAALGARTARAGRRRGDAVGIWEVLPRLGPRRRVEVVSRQYLHMWPEAEVLSADTDDL
jgi:hypothetical protein